MVLISLVFMLMVTVISPVFAAPENPESPLTNQPDQPKPQPDQSNNTPDDQTDKKDENPPQENPTTNPPPKSEPKPDPKQEPPSEPKEDKKPPKELSLAVSYQLKPKTLTVHGKLNQKIDDGVFTVSFQGITQQFEGPGSAFTAHFPRSKLKPGTHTLVVSFKGMIGDQVVKASQRIRVTIPASIKTKKPKEKTESSPKKKTTFITTFKTNPMGGPLPKTATNQPLYILTGFLLFGTGVGISVWFRQKMNKTS